MFQKSPTISSKHCLAGDDILSLDRVNQLIGFATAGPGRR